MYDSEAVSFISALCCVAQHVYTYHVNLSLVTEFMNSCI